MPDQTYVLDANVFIQASRMYYAFDIAPKFWEKLVLFAGDGKICSIDQIETEILVGKDNLADWVEKNFKSAFAPTDDPDVMIEYAKVISWTESQAHYLDYAKTEFASIADGWLIAYAKAKGYTLITTEQPEPLRRNKVKIPDVCNALGVPWDNQYEMLRNLGIVFN